MPKLDDLLMGTLAGVITLVGCIIVYNCYPY